MPDASKWAYNTSVFIYIYRPSDQAECRAQEPAASVTRKSYTFTHPSGATGFFEFDPTRHIRLGTTPGCTLDPDDNSVVQGVAPQFDTYALARKTISGPGVAGLVWTLAFNQPSLGNPDNSTKLATLTMPNGERTRFTFGTEFYKNEGKLLKEEILSANGTQLRLTENTYAIDSVSPAYAYHVGNGVVGPITDEFASTFQVPLIDTKITQQGEIFWTHIDDFTQTLAPGSINSGREYVSGRQARPHLVTISFQSFLDQWVLDQLFIKQAGDGDRIIEVVDYVSTRDPVSLLPTKHQTLGQVAKTYEYFADGTLKKIIDPSLKAVTLDNWWRGTPQRVTYADQKYSTEEIDNFGAISSQTDELFNTTTIARDSAGRISSITHPAGDSVAWNSLSAGFVQVQSTAFGLPASHWERTVTVSTKTTRQYFDALYRPVLTEEYDANNPTGTKAYFTAQFDHAGRTTFQSYPVRSISNYTDSLPGIRTTFDALGRATLVLQSSELGNLATVTEYLPGFKKRVTNARGKATTFEYLTVGAPTEDYPVKILLPENVVIEIDRDVLGRVRRMNRSGTTTNGAAVSSTRQYFRDELSRQCAVQEPERGTAYTHYANDGTVDWIATLPGAAQYCDTNFYATIPESAKTYHSYDLRKRLTGVSFPDGTPGTALTYYDDGAVKTASSDGTLWEFAYNKRRLLTQEKLTVGAKVYTLGYGFDANANASSMTYPDGMQIDYAPNALGQPSKVGSFATGLQYSASGALTNFNYGNTLTHTMTQNARLLPGRVQVRNAAGTASILDTTLSFDANGNVLGLTDGVAATNQSRAMTYDDLDRLKTVSSSASTMFGNASYSYDGLDNLTGLTVSAGAKARSYSYNYNQVTQRLNDITNNSSGQTAFNLGYDEHGNVTSRSGAGSASVGFVFDRAERIRQFNSGTVGASENYTYDAKGRRALITKVSDASKKRYQLYSGSGQLVWEEDSDGVKKRHVYLGGTLLAREELAGAAPALQPPASLNLSPTGQSATGNFTASWPASVGTGLSYTLEWCVADDFFDSCVGVWQTITRSNPGSLTQSVSNASYGGKVLFRVYACLAANCSVNARESAPYLLSPPRLAVLAPASAQSAAFTVSWPASMAALSYTLEESANATTWAVIGNLLTTTSFLRTPAAAGSYQYRVTAVNAAGSRGPGASSALVSYNPGSAACTPPVPAGFTGTPALSVDGNFQLSWQASCNTVRYSIEERGNGGAYALFSDVPAPNLSLSVSGKPSGIYEYRIMACSPDSKKLPMLCSAFSAPIPVQVALPAGLLAPTNFALAPGSLTYTNGDYWFQWNTVNSASHYQVCEHDVAGGVANACRSFTALNSSAQKYRHSVEEQLFTYFYDVAACNASACSAASRPQKAVKIECPLGTPPNQCIRTRPSDSTRDAGTVTYIHTDQLGSPVAETNAAGTLTQRFRYEPFGQSLEANIAQGPGYTGHVADAASGLIYMQQRYYDPVIGRFLSTDPDPVNGLGTNFNRYAYVGNNPYKYVDPDGRASDSALDRYADAVGASPEAFAPLRGPAFVIAAVMATGGGALPALAEAAGGLAVAGSVAATGEIAGATQIAAAALTPTVEIAAAVATDGVVGGVVVGAARKAGSSGGVGAGKAFGAAVRQDVVAESKALNSGVVTCAECRTPTVPGAKSTRGVTPPGNEAQIDHVVARSKGGNNTIENAEVVCRDCNRKKSDK